MPMKGGLKQPPLAQVQVVFAGQQAMTQQHLRALEADALVEHPVPGHEHIADVVGIIEHDDGVAAGLEKHHVAILPRQVGEQAQAIAAESEREWA